MSAYDDGIADIDEDLGLWCQAGRKAKLGGRWPTPCPNLATERLGFGDAESGTELELVFCHDHMQQLIAEGWVNEPYMEPDEFMRRRRLGEHRH